MSYFSRLTDIVTCNLSEILSREEDPRAAIDQIIYEIQEGVAGADRSLGTARKQAGKIEEEIAEHSAQAEHWDRQAREALQQNNEQAARRALLRKTETRDLVAGLEQQLASARNLVDHLSTTHRALEARLADAQRKRRELIDGLTETGEDAAEAVATPAESARTQRIDDELEALKRELGQG